MMAVLYLPVQLYMPLQRYQATAFSTWQKSFAQSCQSCTNLLLSLYPPLSLLHGALLGHQQAFFQKLAEIAAEAHLFAFLVGEKATQRFVVDLEG